VVDARGPISAAARWWGGKVDPHQGVGLFDFDQSNAARKRPVFARVHQRGGRTPPLQAPEARSATAGKNASGEKDLTCSAQGTAKLGEWRSDAISTWLTRLDGRGTSRRIRRAYASGRDTLRARASSRSLELGEVIGHVIAKMRIRGTKWRALSWFATRIPREQTPSVLRLDPREMAMTPARCSNSSSDAAAQKRSSWFEDLERVSRYLRSRGQA